MILRFALSILIVLFAGNAFADTHSAATCENKAGQTDVQTAMDAAADGDIVAVPAGSCTWTTTVTINNKSVHLQGAGVGTTNITAGVGTAFNNTALRTVVPSSSKTIEVSGISWTDNGSVPAEGIIHLKGTSLVLKIHDNAFTDWTKRAISVEGLGTYGAVWSNTVSRAAGAGTQQFIHYREGATDEESDTVWETGVTWNSDNYLFVEGNTFTLNKELDGLNDCENGAKFVWRYNTVGGTHGGGPVGGHGYDSIRRSCMARVISYNSFSNSTAIPYGVQLRGGTAVVYGNRFSGTYSTGALALTNMRSCDGCTVCDDGRTKDICDGVTEGFTGDLADGNTAPAGTYHGWPCRDQVGRSGGTDGQVSQPVYQWDNLNGVTTVTGTVYNSASGTCYTTTHIQESRDYFDATSASDAASKGLTFTAPACPSTYSGLAGSCTSTAGTTGYNVASTHTVTPSKTGSGTLSPIDAEIVADAGNSATYTATADNGWRPVWSGTCGATGTGTTYQKTNVTADCTVVVTFETIKIGGVK